MPIPIPSEAEMLVAGRRLAHLIYGTGMRIYLKGDLGTGKTTFVRGFLRGAGFQGVVKSPTYTLVEPYQIGQHVIYHFDFYRLENPGEIQFVGLDEYFNELNICLVEWPERAGEYLPDGDIEIQFRMPDINVRVLECRGLSQGESVVRRFELQA